MSTRQRIAKARSLISGIGGLFAGALVAQLVTWPTLPKAVLVLAVVCGVILVLWTLLPKPRP